MVKVSKEICAEKFVFCSEKEKEAFLIGKINTAY